MWAPRGRLRGSEYNLEECVCCSEFKKGDPNGQAWSSHYLSLEWLHTNQGCLTGSRAHSNTKNSPAKSIQDKKGQNNTHFNVNTNGSAVLVWTWPENHLNRNSATCFPRLTASKNPDVSKIILSTARLGLVLCFLLINAISSKHHHRPQSCRKSLITWQSAFDISQETNHVLGSYIRTRHGSRAGHNRAVFRAPLVGFQRQLLCCVSVRDIFTGCSLFFFFFFFSYASPEKNILLWSSPRNLLDLYSVLDLSRLGLKEPAKPSQNPRHPSSESPLSMPSTFLKNL